MKPEVLFLSAYIALLSFAFVGTATAADSKLEKAVRAADAEWSKVAAAKDLDKTVAFYADDAVVLPPNQPAVTNKDGIRIFERVSRQLHRYQLENNTRGSGEVWRHGRFDWHVPNDDEGRQQR